MKKKKHGFTLAEVLITLVVIGVVAAMTLPTLITSVRTKANATKKEVFKARLLNGLKETAVQDSLMGYDTTMKFTKALGQHYKMFNVCEISDINACYNVEEVVLNAEGDTIAITDITGVKNLKLSEGGGWLDPVTIVATDGTVFIMSYNKNCSITEAELQGVRDEETGKYSDSNEALSCIDGVIDINGVSAPNKWGLDLLSFRNAKLVPDWITVTSNGVTYKVSPELDGKYNWMNAQTACINIGGRLPTKAQLKDLYAVKNKLILNNDTDAFWSSSFPNLAEGNIVQFSTGKVSSAGRTKTYRVLCLGN